MPHAQTDKSKTDNALLWQLVLIILRQARMQHTCYKKRRNQYTAEQTLGA